MKKKINIIGVPCDLGANVRGSSMGPEALRIAGLVTKIKKLGYETIDKGNIEIPIRETIDDDNYIDHISTISNKLAKSTFNSCENNSIPITLGGDHSISIGSISGISHFYNDLGLLWVDTHGDLHTEETTQTNNIHGMPLACLIGKGNLKLTSILSPKRKINPTKTVLLGIRSIDGTEKQLLKESGITFFTMKDIDEFGINEIMERTLNTLTKDTNGIHISFDLDVLDPLQMSSVSTPVHGGLSIREAHSILEKVAQTGSLSSMDMVELNPFVGNTQRDASIAVDLILSALGKSIV